MLASGIWTDQIFVDHLTLGVKLQVPHRPQMVHRWPRPSKLEWTAELQNFRHADASSFSASPPSDPTARMASWARAFESDLQAFAQLSSLPQRCRGRAQRLDPVCLPESAPTAHASRHGEIKLQYDLTGHAVTQWFKQARRLQSLLQAVQAAKASDTAIEHRIS